MLSAMKVPDGTPVCPRRQIALQAAQWDGALLRFTVQGSHGQAVALEVKLNGANTAELNRKATADLPELTVTVRSDRGRNEHDPSPHRVQFVRVEPLYIISNEGEALR